MAGLTVEWNAPVIGATLQRATSTEQPDWREMFGSEKTNRVVLPIWDGSEFFRLVPIIGCFTALTDLAWCRIGLYCHLAAGVYSTRP